MQQTLNTSGRWSRFAEDNRFLPSAIMETVEEGELEDWAELWQLFNVDHELAQQMLPMIESQIHSPYAGQCFGTWAGFIRKILGEAESPVGIGDGTKWRGGVPDGIGKSGLLNLRT